MRKPLLLALVLSLVVCFALVANRPASSEQHMAFGGDEDVQFAKDLWKAIDGYMDWPMGSGVYEGVSPHGKFLRLYYNVVNVGDDYYHVIVKDNFGGEGATMKSVSSDPGKYLAAVTVMVQMEKGYDPENEDWYYVKYMADGSIDENPQGMAMAGRVAKGTDKGCIACHAKAKGGDYVFTNDE